MTKRVYSGKQKKKAKHHQSKTAPEVLDQEHQSDRQADYSSGAEQQAQSEAHNPMQKPNWREKCWNWLDRRSNALQVVAPSIFSALILAAIIIQAVIYKKQWDVMEKALEQQKTAFALSEQPYLWVRSAEIKNFGLGQRVTIDFNIANDGKTPAFDVVLNYTTDLMRSPFPEHPEIKASLQRIPPSKDFLPAAETVPAIFVDNKILDTEDLAKLQSGYLYVFYGTIDYTDVLKVKHRVRFCRFYSQPNLVVCNNNNGIDY